MITVRCPNCDATYQLDPAKLADGGRKLKCAQCQTVWVARLPAEETAPEKVPEVAAVPQEPPVAEAETPVVPPASEPVEGGDPEFAPPPEELLVQRIPGVDSVIKVGGWHQWVRGDNVWRTGALVLVALGVLAGAGVVWGRFRHAAPLQHHEDVKPAVVAEVVSEVVEPPKGVVLHRVHGEVTELQDSGAGKPGGVALTVRGLLANTTSDTLVVPALRLELLGPDGKVADKWPVSGVSGNLEPHSEQAWTVSLTAPDMSSVKGWRVVFVKDEPKPVDGDTEGGAATETLPEPLPEAAAGAAEKVSGTE